MILCLIDFAKAFNRQSHNRLLTCFSDLGTPPYLLRVMSSYFKNRKMVVRHKNVTSDLFYLPGSSAQGTNLGILSFLGSVNSCGVPLEKIMECFQHVHTEDIEAGVNYICHPILPTPDPHISENEARFKYIEGMAVCQAFDRSSLLINEHIMPKPLNFRDRTGHILQVNNKLQERITEIDFFL